MAKVDILERQADFFNYVLFPQLSKFFKWEHSEDWPIEWDITKPGAITITCVCFENVWSEFQIGDYPCGIGSLDIALELIACEYEEVSGFDLGACDEGDVFTFLFK